MEIIKYLRKAGYELSADGAQFIFTKDGKSTYISKRDLEQYLFIKLLEYVEVEHSSK